MRTEPTTKEDSAIYTPDSDDGHPWRRRMNNIPAIVFFVVIVSIPVLLIRYGWGLPDRFGPRY